MDLRQVDGIELMARCIKAEARGEPLRGQLAVGCVIRTRVKDYRWPKTLQGVILQSRQFSCCDPKDKNYWVMLEPAPGKYVGMAELIMAGLTMDPSVGATNYHATWCDPYPLWTFDEDVIRTVTISKHVFYFERPRRKA